MKYQKSKTFQVGEIVTGDDNYFWGLPTFCHVNLTDIYDLIRDGKVSVKDIMGEYEHISQKDAERFAKNVNEAIDDRFFNDDHLLVIHKIRIKYESECSDVVQ